MGDCSEAGRSGGIILTPAPFYGHCSSRCGSHGPALMIPRASGGCEPLITFCLARAQSIVIYAALQPPCSPFTMGTRRWRPLRAQTRLSGRGGNAECRSERSIPRRAACIATCVDFILIPFSFALNP